MEENFRNFDLASFKKASEEMIAKNEDAFLDKWSSTDSRFYKLTNYTPERIEKIISEGDLEQKILLSQVFFEQNGIYKRILMHYASLYKYTGLLIPKVDFGKDFSKGMLDKYNKALSFVDKVSLQNLCFNFALRVLRDGAYYGILLKAKEKELIILDLPAQYCRSIFKDANGNDVIDFNVEYFDSFLDTESRKKALKAFPKLFSNAYNNWKKGKRTTHWVSVPTSMGVCFCGFGDASTPLFLNVIARVLDYEQAVETEKERELEEIKKIIVQKVPHLSNGELVFEPIEAKEMHSGTVEMMKNNKNVSILTTYTDVDAITSKSSSEAAKDNLSHMIELPNIEAGTSKELFSSSTSSGLPFSLKGHMAFMAPLVQKFSNFFTTIINLIFSNKSIGFKYMILPVTYYNEKEFVEMSLSLANSGYSFAMPAAALGISPHDLLNLKNLEIDALNLDEKLIPLKTSYTLSTDESNSQSDNKGGGQTKDLEDKAAQTIQIQDAGTGGTVNE